MWPCSLRYQGGMILNKEASLTISRMLESPLAWVLNIHNLCHGGSLGFDQEFDGELVVVVIPHGIQQGLRHLKWI